MARIETVDALEAVVGKKPPALDLKVIDHIDSHAANFLSHARAMFGCIAGSAGLTSLIAGGKPGFATPDHTLLKIPHESLDPHGELSIGSAFGSLWLVPGLGETLRINGYLKQSTHSHLMIEVTECYLHCAKAFIRSGFWDARPGDDNLDDPIDFVRQSSFMTLGTIDQDNRADLSPKGDPAGRLAMFKTGEIHFADRPGNKRTDSFRNILSQPEVCATFVIPGCLQMLTVKAAAYLSTNEDLFAPFTVDGKKPKLVVKLHDARVELNQSAALEQAHLWPSPDAPNDLDPAKIFTAHMKLSKQKGLASSVTRTIVSMPGVMRRGLADDYKNNLY